MSVCLAAYSFLLYNYIYPCTYHSLILTLSLVLTCSIRWKFTFSCWVTNNFYLICFLFGKWECFSIIQKSMMVYYMHLLMCISSMWKKIKLSAPIMPTKRMCALMIDVCEEFWFRWVAKSSIWPMTARYILTKRE